MSRAIAVELGGYRKASISTRGVIASRATLSCEREN